MRKRIWHSLILAGILVLLLPMGFNLRASGLISIGFAAAFSLMRLNAKLVN